jgi:hypothetical protein
MIIRPQSDPGESCRLWNSEPQWNPVIDPKHWIIAIRANFKRKNAWVFSQMAYPSENLSCNFVPNGGFLSARNSSSFWFSMKSFHSGKDPSVWIPFRDSLYIQNHFAFARWNPPNFSVPMRSSHFDLHSTFSLRNVMDCRPAGLPWTEECQQSGKESLISSAIDQKLIRCWIRDNHFSKFLVPMFPFKPLRSFGQERNWAMQLRGISRGFNHTLRCNGRNPAD